MKILITTDAYAPRINGVVTSIVNLEKGLQALGHEVKILTVSENTASGKNKNVYSITSLPLRVYPESRFPISTAKDFVRELVEWKPDVVHSQCEFFSYHFAKHIAHLSGAPLVHTYHTMYEQCTQYLLKGLVIRPGMVPAIVRLRLRSADALIAPTEKVQSSLVGYGIEKPVYVVSSGIDLSRFGLGKAVEQSFVYSAVKRKLGIPEGDKVLLSLGRLGYEKKVDMLLGVFPEILKRHPNTSFIIVGDGPANQDLQNQARQLGIANKVFFTGMVSSESTGDFYRLADIFASASLSEAQGLTYIEAMACGLPLVCRTDECLKGVVDDEVNGLTFSDERKLIENINRLLEDTSLRQHMSGVNLKRVQSFGQLSFAENAVEVYKSVIKSIEETNQNRKIDFIPAVGV